MLRRQRLAVHLVCEQHLFAQSILQREAPLVHMLDAALDTAVESGEDDLGSVSRQPCLMKQRRQRRARPLGRADSLHEPRLAERSR